MSVYTLHGYVYKNSREAHACHAHDEMWFVGVVFTQAEPILWVSFNSCDLTTHMLLILYNIKMITNNIAVRVQELIKTVRFFLY